MIEIKFKAWDNDMKKWSNTPMKYAIEDINYYTDYAWCQYIGLKDIHDKEIYVGDFLKDDENFIWEVLPLSDGMFKISCDDLLAVESAYPRVRICEIVGNAFEKISI